MRFAALGLAACAMLLVFLSPQAPVHAQFGLDQTVKNIKDSSGKQVVLQGDPNAIIGRVISSVLGFVGVIFFLLMLYAGFLWMTARGNEKTAAQAKEIIISAIIGLAIVTGAYAITTAIFKGLTTAPASDDGVQNPPL